LNPVASGLITVSTYKARFIQTKASPALVPNAREKQALRRFHRN